MYILPQLEITKPGALRSPKLVFGWFLLPDTISIAVLAVMSIRLSIRLSSHASKHSIMQAPPHDSPGTLVFWRQKSRWNSNGVMYMY